jgi:hypothetical protein
MYSDNLVYNLEMNLDLAPGTVYIVIGKKYQNTSDASLISVLLLRE